MRLRLISSILALFLASLPAGAADETLPNLPEPIRSDALTGARIVVADRMTIAEGTILLRDGVIQAVGERIEVPPDARVWDLSGKTVYPGLIDAWTEVGLEPRRKESRGGGRRGGAPPAPSPTSEERGPVHELSRVRPERRAADAIRTDAKSLKSWREAGFTAVAVVPREGIFRGPAALLNLGDGGPGRNLVIEEVGQVVGFESGGRQSREYPGSLIGAIALVRQTLLDAAHYEADWTSYETDPAGRGRPDVNGTRAPRREPGAPGVATGGGWRRAGLVRGRQPARPDPRRQDPGGARTAGVGARRRR